jgi:hypothetical protein
VRGPIDPKDPILLYLTSRRLPISTVNRLWGVNLETTESSKVGNVGESVDPCQIHAAGQSEACHQRRGHDMDFNPKL